MGLLNLPAAPLSWLDGLLGAALPPIGRIVVWALIASVATMWLYHGLSRQSRLADLKRQAQAAQRALVAYDGDFDGLRPLVMQSLTLSLRRLGASLVPATLASLPVLFLIVWLGDAYGYRTPQPGDPVAVRAASDGAVLSWRPGAAEPLGAGQWRVGWPAPGDELRLADRAGRVLLSLPLAAPSPVVHKHRWWNLIMGNPAGYLPDGGAVDRVEIALPRRTVLAWGYSWMRGWEAAFFTVLVLASLAIRTVFGIE